MQGGLLFFLFVVLLILKLTGTVVWSWWIITLPLWIPFVFVFIFLIIWFLLELMVNR